jgi:FkbM family methyltransferase
MGVPVVSLASERHAGRVGASLLARVDLGDLCANDVDEYVNRACSLAADAARRASLRQDLRERMRGCSLGDPLRFVPTLEAAYRAIWRRHCEAGGIDSRRFRRASLPGDVPLYVPAAVDSISSFVVREQGDWFEDEIRFVRRLVQEGDRVLDVGANVGFYALSMAACVGETGRVWAFEPAPASAELLRLGAEQGYERQLQVVERALSNRVGEVSLFVSPDAELSTLRADAHRTGAAPIAVHVSTLDHCREELDLRDISFIKLDAEGEEAAILEGGLALLETEAPLVMYELEHAGTVREDLIARFDTLGYRAYRLVSGLGALVPFDLEHPPSPLPLNSFACPDARAEVLCARGLLVRELDAAPASSHRDPVARACALVRRPAASPNELPLRAAEMCATLAQLRDAADTAAQTRVLLALARIAACWGERAVALKALDEAATRARRGDVGSLTEPLLAPVSQFDAVAVDGRENAWVEAACLAAMESYGTHSAFFTPEQSLRRLTRLTELGFADEETRRRLELIQMLLERLALLRN